MRALPLVLITAVLIGCPPPSNPDGGGGGGGGGGAAMGGGHAGGGMATGGGPTGGGTGTGGATGTGGGGHIIPPNPDGGWCAQPGAWVHDDGGYHQVSGLTGPGRDLSWMQLPEGFCARYFGNVGNPREMRFAPGGELFVASPTMGTTSGGPQGTASIKVLPDDNNDGLADTTLDWRTGLPATQGILFANGSFYYQNFTHIMKEPYASGDRAPTGQPVEVANILVYVSSGHWPKTLDQAEDGTIYVSNGGDEGELCDPTRPFHGGILALDANGDGGVREIAKGLRNPIYVRCHHDGNNRCFADELARDYSTSVGGREKLLPIREGDDWGYPCCASYQLPYTDVCLACSAITEPMGSSSATCMSAAECSPKCDTTVPESASFIIGDTPFGLDFVDTQFPPPWDHHVFIAPHGAFGTWVGARVVGVRMDPATGLAIDGGVKENFLQGWDDGLRDHGRPSDITAAPDGRLFISNDQTGDIIWIAPTGP
jgi:glucose/arabinose dehydrogenase